MVILELAYLLEGLARIRAGHDATSVAEVASAAVGGHWDYLRWFLAVHYRFNRRLDTPFWRAARADVDVSGMREVLDRFRHEGAWLLADGARFAVSDPTFGYAGLMMMLLGQRADGAERTRAPLDRAAWSALRARHAGVAARALPHADALRALAEHPEMLAAFVESRGSWCRADRERATTIAASASW
jgi:tryptophan halogenase